MSTFWPQLFTFCMFILAWLFWMDYKKHIRWVRVLTGWYWGNRAPNQVKKCVLLIFFFVEIVDISSNYLWKNMFLSSFSFDFLYLFLHRKSPWSISFSPIPVFIFYLCIIFIFTVSIEKSMASDFAPDLTLFRPHWCYLYRLYNICVITVYRCNVFSVFSFYF